MKPIILLSLVYFLTRLINLTLIPIFTDEAIYLRWSQVMANNLNFLFLPLTDGKAPLFIWAAAGLMHFVPWLDPLVAGRLVSVLCGFLSLVGVYVASYALFKNTKVSIFSSLLYIFSPFTFFYDRFALVDSMLTMFGIWILAFSVLLTKSGKLIYSLLLGLAIGFGMLTKTQGLFFFLIFPLCWLFLKTNLDKNFFLWTVLSTVLGFLIYNFLRVFNEFYILGIKTSEFIVPLGDLLTKPFEKIPENLPSLLSWQIAYLTIPVVILVIASLFKKQRERVFLITVYLIYLVTMATINKVIYARYLLMFTPFLLILAGAALNDIKNKRIKILVAALVLVLPLITIFTLLTNPKNAAIADNDSNQYINSWSAGFGLRETVEFFASLPKEEKTVLGVEGTFGLLPFALEMYSSKYPNLEIRPLWPPPGTLPEGLDYYIIYQRPTPESFPLELIEEYQQGKSDDFFKLYKVK